MNGYAASVMNGHPIFASRDAGETEAFLASKQFRLDYPRGDDTPCDTQINGIYLPGSFIGTFYYGPRTITRATPVRTDFWIQLASQRCFELSIGGEGFICDARLGAVLSPLRENLTRSDTGCGRLVMSLTGSAVLRQLVALLGRPLAAPLEFAPSLDITSGYGRSIAEYIKTAARDLEHNDALLHSPLAMSQFEQFIITGLLLSHRHNYSGALARPEGSISSRDVKRATDYIQANLEKVMTLPDIVSAAGVPGRTLFKHFRQFTGMTPMRYLRNARLMRVHDVLLKAPDSASIAAIASNHGFDHLGRFAVEYRKRFGEKPSETYARRNRPGARGRAPH